VRKKVTELTDRQREVLDYIIEAMREQGYPPTVREIAEHFNMASGFGVQRHLEALQKKGFIRRESGARAMTLAPEVLATLDNLEGAFPKGTPAPINARLVPLIGQVAAGVPITAEENVEEMIPLPDDWVRGKGDIFLLRVKGDSMAPGIENRDLVIVRAQASAENGMVVVAVIDEEATVKRFFRDRGGVVLRADNPAYDDIHVHGSFRLSGRVVGLVRHY
jgi:repressor LexA